MASDDLFKRLENAKRDLSVVQSGQNFVRIKNTSALLDPWTDAKALAMKWLARIEPVVTVIDSESLQPLILFMEQVARIGDGQEVRQNESIPDAIRRVKAEFLPKIPMLIYGLLDARGIAGLSDEDFTSKRLNALKDIDSAVDDANVKIRENAKEAVEEFERAKTRASRISVDSAERQFTEAAIELKNKALRWGILTTVLFAALIFFLSRFFWHPPSFISYIEQAIEPGSKQIALPVSVPLLVAGSAYFTGLRLAFLGVIGIGFAFSLRMVRAYLHMIEHNHHKMRVTKSIEAFVAAVRTDTQKDLVLSKLVESVTEFGDSGILGKQTEQSNLPSVIFEAMTKNVGRPE